MGNLGKRVLVTGTRGFTGIHLRRELELHQYTVIGLDNVSPLGPNECLADLTDAASVRAAVLEATPDYVVHLAAISFVAHTRVEDLYRVNVLGTLNLLEALTLSPTPPKRIVLASSANVYGDATIDFDESCPTSPPNHYAATKVAMEAIASVYRTNFPITITRPFNYTGPGQAAQFLVPKLVEHFARRSSRIELGNLDVERDFLDVRTVATLYRDLLETGSAESQVVNLCSGRGVKLQEIVDMLRSITGHSPTIEVDPGLVRKVEIKRLVGSTARLLSLVKNVAELPLEQTLRDMLAQRANG